MVGTVRQLVVVVVVVVVVVSPAQAVEQQQQQVVVQQQQQQQVVSVVRLLPFGYLVGRPVAVWGRRVSWCEARGCR